MDNDELDHVVRNTAVLFEGTVRDLEAALKRFKESSQAFIKAYEDLKRGMDKLKGVDEDGTP